MAFHTIRASALAANVDMDITISLHVVSMSLAGGTFPFNDSQLGGAISRLQPPGRLGGGEARQSKQSDSNIEGKAATAGKKRAIVRRIPNDFTV